MSSAPSLRFLAPSDHLPAEGFEASSGQDISESGLFRAYRDLLEKCDLGFEVTPEGVTPLGSTTDTVELIDLGLGFRDSSPAFQAGEEEVTLTLPELDSSETAFDGCETEDEYVRAFVDWMKPDIQKATATFEGQQTPILRWAPREGGSGIQVQFLGLLDTETGNAGELSDKADGSWVAIYDDPEVEGHGLREAAVSLAIVAVSLGAATDAEAGPFQGLFKKRNTVPVEQVSYRRAAEPVAVSRAATQPGYQDSHRDARINHALLGQQTTANSRIVVDVGAQRAYLIVNDQVAINTAVSTARSGKHTPRGTFKITQRVESGKTSTIYGCALPYWMRLDQSAIGMHVGDLPGYPASAGCIRLPVSIAPLMFQNTQSGTTVQVVDNFNLASLQGGAGGMLVASNP